MSTESKTPESDKKEYEQECGFEVMWEDFARTLETQRDEARAMIKGYESSIESDSVVASCNCLTKTPEIKFHKLGCKYRLIVERDEAKAEVERLREVIESAYRILSPYKLSDTWHGHLCRNLYASLHTTPPDTAIPASSTTPEIFEAHGLEWYRHDGGPCPCDPEMKICVCLDNDSCTYAGVKAKRWDWRPCNSGKILGWRPADAPAKLPRNK